MNDRPDPGTTEDVFSPYPTLMVDARSYARHSDQKADEARQCSQCSQPVGDWCNPVHRRGELIAVYCRACFDERASK